MNITDIAKMADVSVSAVSRYLNNGYISEEKKQRVKEAIEKTGYKPSRQAQMLRTKKSKVIGVVVPKISSEAVSRIVDGISTCLSEKGYQMLIATTENNTDKEIEYLTLFDHTQVDGIIFVATWFSKAHKTVLRKLSIPFVLVGQKYEKYASVYNDDVNAARELTDILLDAGCRNLACFYVTEKDEAAGFNRKKGFKKALTARKMRANVEQFVETDFSIESGYAAATQLLEQYPQVDGIFCATDAIAIGAMQRLKEEGKNVPKDVRIVSIGHTRLSRVVYPKLETVHFYYKNAGIESAKMILEMIEKEELIDRQVMLGFEIIHGESV